MSSSKWKLFSLVLNKCVLPALKLFTFNILFSIFHLSSLTNILKKVKTLLPSTVSYSKWMNLRLLSKSKIVPNEDIRGKHQLHCTTTEQFSPTTLPYSVGGGTDLLYKSSTTVQSGRLLIGTETSQTITSRSGSTNQRSAEGDQRDKLGMAKKMVQRSRRRQNCSLSLSGQVDTSGSTLKLRSTGHWQKKQQLQQKQLQVTERQQTQRLRARSTSAFISLSPPFTLLSFCCAPKQKQHLLITYLLGERKTKLRNRNNLKEAILLNKRNNKA